MFTRAFGSKTKQKGRGSIFWEMVPSMKGSGMKISNMERAGRLGRIKPSSRGITSWARKMVLVSLNESTDPLTRET